MVSIQLLRYVAYLNNALLYLVRKKRSLALQGLIVTAYDFGAAKVQIQFYILADSSPPFTGFFPLPSLKVIKPINNYTMRTYTFIQNVTATVKRLKRKLFYGRLSFLILFSLLASPAISQPLYLASGANAAALTPVVTNFRTALGALNPNVAGPLPPGRREINWDGVPDALSAPNNLPANFFNVNSPRGVIFSTPGTGFQLSANAGVAPVEFGNIDPSYPALFATFSPQRLFTALGSNITDINFFVPGTNIPALTRAFGVVFSDVDLASITRIQYFDKNGIQLGNFDAQAFAGNESFSFLGFDFGVPIIARVRITTGNNALGAGIIEVLPTRDLVVMDDFIYGEPVGITTCTPTTTVTEGDLSPGGLASFGVTSGPGTVTVDHINSGTGLQSLTVVGVPINATVNIPAFTPGTFNPVTVTFTATDPALPVDFTLRAASVTQAIFIRVRCSPPAPPPCTPSTTVTEGDLSPGGLASFGVTSGPGTVTVDHINSGTGLQSFTVVGVPINATVNIPAFTPGTFNPVTVTFTATNPALPVDFTLRAASVTQAIFIRVRCAGATPSCIITCPANMIVSNDPNQCGAVVNYPAPLTTGSCGTITATPASGSFFPVGTTTVNVSSTAGQSCSFTVRVNDAQAPSITSCPTVSPFCVNSTGNYTIPALTATDNCPGLTVSFSISGATTRTGTGNNASGAFAVGTSTINWTIRDVAGNASTCQTTVRVNVGPTVTIPDAFALPSGVAANTVYIGYAPASSIMLTANASGGSPPYTYTWSTGSHASSITVSPTVTTTYTVTVTDANGCTGTASKTIFVVDVRCGKKLDKVQVCHVPPGNPSNAHGICISANAVPAHLANGSYLGECINATNTITSKGISSKGIYEIEQNVERLTVQTISNPAPAFFTLVTRSNNPNAIQLRVFNVLGKVVEVRNHVAANSTLQLGQNYRPGMYYAEVVQGKERVILKLIKGSK